jgi:hypothetical protein
LRTRLILASLTFGASLCVVAPGSSIELEAGVGSMGGGCCSWWLTIRPDGVATVQVAPAGHLSRKFTLSTSNRAELAAMLAREDFFSLPMELGALAIDGDGAQVTVTNAGRSHQVRLNTLPGPLDAVWRTDPSPVGRAFRVCEYLRALTGVREARHCPGVSDERE